MTRSSSTRSLKTNSQTYSPTSIISEQQPQLDCHKELGCAISGALRRILMVDFAGLAADPAKAPMAPVATATRDTIQLGRFRGAAADAAAHLPLAPAVLAPRNAMHLWRCRCMGDTHRFAATASWDPLACFPVSNGVFPKKVLLHHAKTAVCCTAAACVAGPAA